MKSIKIIKHQSRRPIIVVFVCLFAFVILLFFKSLKFLENKRTPVNNFSYKPQVDRFESLKSSFVFDLENGIKNEQTKLNAYLFVMRYFNNGGNIYEVYDYINANPKLAFLKNAENIYPEVFKEIKNKQLPFTYSDEGLYACLSYLEILEGSGYGDVAVTGTLAHQYAKFAYYKKMILKDKNNGMSLNYPNYTKEGIGRDIKKAIEYAKITDSEVGVVVKRYSSTKERVAMNTLNGFTQYASSLRYLEAMNEKFAHTVTSKEVFSFLIRYTSTQLTDLYLFNALSDAATLLLLNDSTDKELRNAIAPFLSIKDTNGFVKKIIDARYQNSASRFRDLEVYSNTTIQKLASRVPEFKLWLTTNGWVESDFK